MEWLSIITDALTIVTSTIVIVLILRRWKK